MTKQELVNKLKRYLRGVFKESDLTVGEHRAMKHHLEDFMSVSKLVTQGERFVELIDINGSKCLIKVTAIDAMVKTKGGIKHKGLCFVEYGGLLPLELNVLDNEEVLENLIADLKE